MSQNSKRTEGKRRSERKRKEMEGKITKMEDKLAKERKGRTRIKKVIGKGIPTLEGTGGRREVKERGKKWKKKRTKL